MSTPATGASPRFVVPLGLAITVVVAAIYFVTSHLSAFWATSGRASSPIFPGVGAALAAMILFGRQYWPSIFAARLLAFWLAGSDREPWLMAAIAGANTLTAWAGAGGSHDGAAWIPRSHACATCCGWASAGASAVR